MMKARILLVTSALVLTALIVAGVLFLRSSYLREKIRLVLEQQLQQQLDHPVQIGQVEGNVLKNLSVRDIVIKAKAKAATASSISSPMRARETDLLETKEIRFKYQLWGLLFGRFLVTELKVTDPQINLTIAADGRLILPQLRITGTSTEEADTKSENQKNHGPSFAASTFAFRSNVSNVKIEDGTIKIIDPYRNLQFGVTGVQMSVRGPLDRWDHHGNLAVQDGQIVINGVETRIGGIETEFDLSQKAGQLRQMQLALGNSKMTVSGQANSVDPSSLGPDTPASTASSTFQAKVDIDLDFRDLANFFPDYQIEGEAEIRLETQGSVEGITGQLGIKLPFAKLNQLYIEQFTTYARFSENQLSLREISGKLADGTLNGWAEIKTDVTTEAVRYRGQLELLQARAEKFFPMIYDLTNIVVSTGQVDSTLSFEGQSLDLAQWQIRGKLAYSDGQLNQIPIGLSELNWTVEQDQLQATANLDQAQIHLKGTAGFKQERHIDLQIQQIQMGKLSQILAIPDLSGDGQLTGTLVDQKLEGQLQVPKAYLFRVPIGILTADFDYQDGLVTIQPLELVRNQSRLTIIGTAKASSDVPVDLLLRVDPFYIQDYIRLVGEYPVQGLAKGRLYLNGTLRSLDGRGAFQIEDGRAWDLRFDPVTLPMQIDDYLVKIHDFELFARGQRGVMNFEINPDLDYSLEFKTDPVSLQQIAYARGEPNFPLDSRLILTAQGTGNAAYPYVDLQADLADIRYEVSEHGDVSLPPATITGIFADDRLDLEGIGFGNSCRLRGTIMAAPGTPYQLLIRGKQMDASQILQIINPYVGSYFAGRADGSMTLNGDLEDLATVELDLELDNFLLIPSSLPPSSSAQAKIDNSKDVRANQAKGDFANKLGPSGSMHPATLTNDGPVKIRYGRLTAGRLSSLPMTDKGWIIERFWLRGEPEMAIMVTDKYIRPNVTTQIPSIIHDFATGQTSGIYFTNFFGLPKVLSGRISYRLSVNESFNDFILDWSCPELELIASTTELDESESEIIDLIRFNGSQGRLKFDGKQVTLAQTSLLLNDNLIDLRGRFTLDQPLPEIEGLPDTGNQISFQCNNFDLSKLKLSSIWPNVTYLTGQADLSAQITGNLKRPYLRSSIGLNQVHLATDSLPVPIDNLMAQLRISSDLTPLVQNSSPTQSPLSPEQILPLLADIKLTSAVWQTDSLIGAEDMALVANSRFQSTATIQLVVADTSTLIRGRGISVGRWQADLSGKQIELQPFLQKYLPRPAASSPLNGIVTLAAQFKGQGFKVQSATVDCPDLSLNLSQTPFYVQEPARLRFSDETIYIDNLKLSTPPVEDDADSGLGTFLELSGQLSSNVGVLHTPTTLLLELKQLPLEDVYALVSLFVADLNLNFNNLSAKRGWLSGRASLGQTLDDPTIISAWQLDFADAQLMGQITYLDQQLSLRQGQLAGLHISGNLPIKLSLLPSPTGAVWQPLNQPLQVALTGKKIDFGLLSHLASEISRLKLPRTNDQIWPQDVSGQMEVDLRILGTTMTPYLQGSLTLQDGRMNFLELPLSKINWSIQVKPDAIAIPVFQLNIGNSHYHVQADVAMDGLQPQQLIIDDCRFVKAQVQDLITLTFGWLTHMSQLGQAVTVPQQLATLISGQLSGNFSSLIPLALSSKKPSHTSTFDLEVEDLRLNLHQPAVPDPRPPIGAWDRFGAIVNTQPLHLKLQDQRLSLDSFTLVSSPLASITDLNIASGKPPIRARQLQVTGLGSWQLGQALDFGFAATNIDLKTLIELLSLDQAVPKDLVIDGSIDTKLQVSGTVTTPQIALNWQAKTPITLNQTEADTFEGHMVLDGKHIFIGNESNPVRVKIGQNQLLFDLEIDGVSQEDGSTRQQIGGRLDLQAQDLGVLPLLFPQVGYAGGRGSVNLTLGGRLESPKLKGFAKFQKVKLNLPDLRINIEQTEINLDFTDQGIEIRELQGRLNNGRYKIDGWVESKWSPTEDRALTDLNVQMSLREGCTFEYPNLYSVRLNSADLVLNGQTMSSPNDQNQKSILDTQSLLSSTGLGVGTIGDNSMSWTPLQGELRGSLTIDQGQYEQRWEDIVAIWSGRSGDTALRQLVSELPFWQNLKLNLEILAPENVKLISEFGDVEIETAINGQLDGPIWQPIFKGRVDLLQGEFSFFAIDQPFKILEGSYIENGEVYSQPSPPKQGSENQFVFNPKYSILTETTQPIRNVDLVTVDGQIRNRDLVIRANLSGYLNEKHNPVLSAEVLEKELGEEYRLDQKQILSILTLGMVDPSTLTASSVSGVSAVVGGVGDQFSPMVSSFFLQQGQRYVGGRIAKMVGFRQTRFNLNPNEFESSRFLLTKEISSRLVLTYSSTFQLHTEPRIEIEYELGKNFAIKGERNEGKFGVDLKVEKKF